MCCGSRCIWRWRRCREAEEGRKEGMDCFEVFVGNGNGEEGGGME